jgi:DNA-binding response OmpR family regulator
VLADDDPEVAHIVDAHMRAGGFSTTIAFDGQQAIEESSGSNRMF